MAEIWTANPTKRPQTIRALFVHSARWTPAIEAQFPNKAERLRAVGYGIPSTDEASWSTSTRPTVIFEGQLHPLRRLGRGREMHFHALPFPEDVLVGLADTPLEISVTLSYFAQPNETRGVRYTCAGLRWGMQRPFESATAFRKRINRLEREDGEKFHSDAEDLDWEIGVRQRERGTIQSDRAKVRAAELTGSRAIAVWPVGGWWDDRDFQGDPPLRYSLVISVDAGDVDVDLYTPILNEISIQTEIR
jgi:hypothetical protein